MDDQGVFQSYVEGEEGCVVGWEWEIGVECVFEGWKRRLGGECVLFCLTVSQA